MSLQKEKIQLFEKKEKKKRYANASIHVGR